MATVLGGASSRGAAKTLILNQGKLYPALLRLEQSGWIKAERGKSESNRHARFYSVTRAGRGRIREKSRKREHIAATMSLFLGAPS